MREIKVRELTKQDFEKYGWFASMRTPETAVLGEPPNEFARDILPLKMSSNVASCSICRVKKQPLVIKEVEHSNTFEKAMLPLDGDIVIFVAEATPPGDIPLDRIEAFRVPQYTLAKMRVGVWHHAPFGLEKDETNVLIVTPDRFYVNDIFVKELEEADRILIKE